MIDETDSLPIDPTTEVDSGLTPAEIRLCPGCGMPEPQWKGNRGRGYLYEDGHTYCCGGCAQQTGCTCA